MRTSRLNSAQKVSDFEDKYLGKLETALEDILNQYQINPDSRLAYVIKVALRKFVLGLEEKLSAYINWLECNIPHISDINQQFNKCYPAYPMDYKGLIRYTRQTGINKTLVDANITKLLDIDIGRNKAVINVERLIRDSINANSDGDCSIEPRQILGTIIRHSLDIYYSENGDDIEVNFCRKPETVAHDLIAIKYPSPHKT